jgi:hypothetical protein
MAVADVWAAAKKFADELTEQLPDLKKHKAEVEIDVSNAEQAMDRYSRYKGKRDNGTYQCPQCWICLGVDNNVGPDGRTKDERGREIWKCVRCDYGFVPD